MEYDENFQTIIFDVRDRLSKTFYNWPSNIIEFTMPQINNENCDKIVEVFLQSGYSEVTYIQYWNAFTRFKFKLKEE